jgi:hypothetical protein
MPPALAANADVNFQRIGLMIEKEHEPVVTACRALSQALPVAR